MDRKEGGRGSIKTAFILGAGLGTRLRPLTRNCPKPLLRVGGRPLITYAMEHLRSAGVERFIVNTHHCAGAYEEVFPAREWRGIPIIFRHEPVLLDTAGGLKNIEDLLDADKTLLVYNGDIIADFPLRALIGFHFTRQTEVTLALRSSGPLLNVNLDEKGRVCDMRGLLGDPGVRRCQFTGIYIIEKLFLARLEAGRIESVVPVFVDMIRENPGSVSGIVIDEGTWSDIGSREEYEKLRRREDENKMKTGSSKEYRSFIRKTLDLPEGETIRVEMLFQGGSERSFYRVRTGDHRSRVFMHYNPARKENGYYAAIAVFLDDIGVRVPRLIEHDPARCFILMEDLGDTELLSLQRAPWEQRKNLYRKTLELALKLHAFPLKDFPFRTVSLTEAFGPALYKWERDYFRENFVEGICGIKLESHESEALERELAALAERLDGDGRSLVHRDLQSKNVLISGQEPALIDFQGMRIGNPFYDLGSLLYDPYVSFTDAERSELLSLYRQSSDQFPDRDAFQAAFLLASSQRLMQALGAYAFLGLKRGLRGFLEHIPRGLENLIDASTRAGNLPLLRELAIKCRKVVSSLRFQVERV